MKFKMEPLALEEINTSKYIKPIVHVRFVTKGTNIQQIIESLFDIQETINNKQL